MGFETLRKESRRRDRLSWGEVACRPYSVIKNECQLSVSMVRLRMLSLITAQSLVSILWRVTVSANGSC